MTSQTYIQFCYGVPAKRGMKVKVDGKPGTITHFLGAQIMVRFDGEKRSKPCHPTWEVIYFDRDGNQIYPEVKP